MGPWPVRGKGHCKYCTEILPPSHRAPEDGTDGQWVSTSFLRRAFKLYDIKQVWIPQCQRLLQRSYAQCWHYNNLCYYTVDTILWYSIYSTCNSICLLKKKNWTNKKVFYLSQSYFLVCFIALNTNNMFLMTIYESNPCPYYGSQNKHKICIPKEIKWGFGTPDPCVANH